MRQVIPDDFVDRLCEVASDVLVKNPYLVAGNARACAIKLPAVIAGAGEDRDGKKERAKALAVLLLHGLMLAEHSTLSRGELRAIVGSWESNFSVLPAARYGKIERVKEVAIKLHRSLLDHHERVCPPLEIERFLRAVVEAIEIEQLTTLDIYFAVGWYQGEVRKN